MNILRTDPLGLINVYHFLLYSLDFLTPCTWSKWPNETRANDQGDHCAHLSNWYWMVINSYNQKPLFINKSARWCENSWSLETIIIIIEENTIFMQIIKGRKIIAHFSYPQMLFACQPTVWCKDWRINFGEMRIFRPN